MNFKWWRIIFANLFEDNWFAGALSFFKVLDCIIKIWTPTIGVFARVVLLPATTKESNEVRILIILGKVSHLLLNGKHFVPAGRFIKFIEKQDLATIKDLTSS